MSKHLGKLYSTEITFDDAYSESIALNVTSDPVDLAKISEVVAKSFKTLKTIGAKTLKTLMDTKTGSLLITVRLSHSSLKAI